MTSDESDDEEADVEMLYLHVHKQSGLVWSEIYNAEAQILINTSVYECSTSVRSYIINIV